jgi:AcrR family transcriptional regulator
MDMDTSIVDAPPGLRERKKEQTRRALEDAALDLFERQGFDHTTVEEIAAACDVSPRTFFRYFATKDQLLFGDDDPEFADLLVDLEHRPADEPPFTSVRAAVDALIERFADERDRLVRRARIIATTPSLQHHSDVQFGKVEALIGALARRDAAAGVTRRPLELRLAANVAFAAFHASVETWMADGAQGDLFAIVDEAFHRVEGGLGA